MKVVAAALLAVLGGKENPSADDIKNILSSVGVEADGDDVSRFLKEIEGKNINELVQAGRSKLQSIPSGGGGGGGGAAAPAGGAAGGAAAPAKEEKKEEPSEEDEDMGFSLFD